jgi:ABC-type bacteriocin/lantibiotic exporter with double-glycine peptidase domain
LTWLWWPSACSRSTAPAGSVGAMQVLIYWLIRTVTFLAIYGVLWALNWFDIWAVVLAFIVGWAVSYVAFPRMRVRAAAQMDGWINRSRVGIEADEVVEDSESTRD